MILSSTNRQTLTLFAKRCLIVAAIYALADFAINKVGFTDGWTILWPLNGISIALLITRPRAQWPAILLGIALGTGIGECFDDNSVALELWMRPNSIVEVLLSALVLPPFLSLDRWLRERRILRRFALALAVGPGVSGIVFAIVFHLLKHLGYVEAFLEWAASDALGIAVIVPLALAMRSPEMRDLFRLRNLPRTVAVLLIAFTVAAFALALTSYQLLFLIYPVLLLVDLELSFAGSSIAAAGVCLLAILLAVHGFGPFGQWEANRVISRDNALQAFLAFQILALFPASIVLRERRRLLEDLNSSNAQLLLLALRDGLTGLFNRRSFDEQFQQEWKRAIRIKSPIALLMIDVDHFKQFNDLYGHRAGDECLQTVAQTIAQHTRRAQDHLSRYGGEEFVMILPHTDIEGALHQSERIRASILELNIPHAKSTWQCVTVSVGCSALTPNPETDPDTLLQLADTALYTAKRSGRNATQAAKAPSRIEANTA